MSHQAIVWRSRAGHRRSSSWQPAALLLLSVTAFAPTLLRLAQTWSTDPLAAHGWLMFPVAVALAWTRRPFIKPARRGISIWAMPLLLAGIAVNLTGQRIDNFSIEVTGMVLAFAGGLALAGGKAAWPCLWPAALYLFLLVPLPESFAAKLCGPMQTIATAGSTYALQTLGIPAVAEGHVINLSEGRLGVAEACAGLQMFVGFLAVSSAFALFVERPAWERLVIAASGAPVALVCNVARITLTGFVREYFGLRLAHAVFHDLGGWLMIGLAVACLWGELFILSRLLVPPPDREIVPIAPIHPEDHQSTANPQQVAAATREVEVPVSVSGAAT